MPAGRAGRWVEYLGWSSSARRHEGADFHTTMRTWAVHSKLVHHREPAYAVELTEEDRRRAAAFQIGYAEGIQNGVLLNDIFSQPRTPTETPPTQPDAVVVKVVESELPEEFHRAVAERRARALLVQAAIDNS